MAVIEGLIAGWRWGATLAVLLFAVSGIAPALASEPPLTSMTGGQPLIGENFKLGRDVYRARCAGCHDAGSARAPQAIVLRNLRPDAIFKALDTGVMKPMAAGLSEAEKVAVSEYLAERRLDRSSAGEPLHSCQAQHALFDRKALPTQTGWGLDLANSHAVSGKAAGVSPANLGKFKLKWAFGFQATARMRSQPALAGGAIFIGGQNGYVRALDRETGCERWRFEAAAEVRTTVVVAPWKKGDRKAQPLAFFGDQVGNAYAVKAFTGELVWRKRMDKHPAAIITASPTLYEGTLYVPVASLEEAAAADPGYVCCSFRGSVVALDAATGEEKWRTFMVDEPQREERADGSFAYGPSGVAVWNTPTIDAKRGVLYVATGDNYSNPATDLSDAVVALDLETGRIVWHHQVTQGDAWNVGCFVEGANCPDEEGPDFDFGANTILAKGKGGKDLVLAGQKSGIAYAFDADTGAPVWQTRVGRGGLAGGILFGMAASGGTLFAPVSDFGETKFSNHPASPGLYAIDIASGALRWSAPTPEGTCPDDLAFCQPGISAAITATPQLVFAGGEDGHLRAYDAASGRVLLDIDMLREFPTVNGVAARGGAMSGGGAPIVDGGQLIVASGYGHAMKMAGNVLLVYEVVK